eukprot:1137298-Pelagomonas_calceolata.AAC.5
MLGYSEDDPGKESPSTPKRRRINAGVTIRPPRIFPAYNAALRVPYVSFNPLCNSTHHEELVSQTSIAAWCRHGRKHAQLLGGAHHIRLIERAHCWVIVQDLQAKGKHQDKTAYPRNGLNCFGKEAAKGTHALTGSLYSPGTRTPTHANMKCKQLYPPMLLRGIMGWPGWERQAFPHSRVLMGSFGIWLAHRKPHNPTWHIGSYCIAACLACT